MHCQVAGLVGRADILSTLLFVAAFMSYRKFIISGGLLRLQGVHVAIVWTFCVFLIEIEGS